LEENNPLEFTQALLDVDIELNNGDQHRKHFNAHERERHCRYPL
jgi:hypothetical protein